MKVAALILAKGNSSRVHEKNMRYCAGKRLIEWIIEIAKKTKCIDDVFISTESDKLADVAIKAGAFVLFRPEQLCIPVSGGGITKICALKQMYDSGYRFDYLFDLWCTSPLIQSWQLDDAFEKFMFAKHTKQLSSVTMIKASYCRNTYILDPTNVIMSPWGIEGPPIYFNLLNWCFTNGTFGITNPNIVDYSKLPSVIPEMTYEEIDHAYVEASNAWQEEAFKQNRYIVYGYPIDQISAMHIDTEEDLALAEYYFKYREEKQNARGN